MSKLKNKSIIFYTKRNTMSTVYLSSGETLDLLDNLSPNEHRLYAIVKGMVNTSPPADALKNPELAGKLGVSPQAVATLKNSLKKKGYLVIIFSKSSQGVLLAQVHIGKDQVELYNLGLEVEITDAKTYRELLRKFPINNSTLTEEEREEMVHQANAYYLTQP